MCSLPLGQDVWAGRPPSLKFNHGHHGGCKGVKKHQNSVLLVLLGWHQMSSPQEFSKSYTSLWDERKRKWCQKGKRDPWVIPSLVHPDQGFNLGKIRLFSAKKMLLIGQFGGRGCVQLVMMEHPMSWTQIWNQIKSCWAPWPKSWIRTSVTLNYFIH